MVVHTLHRQLKPTLLGLEVERGSTWPIAKQIVDQLRARIERGELPVGTRLPPSRDFALQLGVARNCVMEAYAELTAIGLLEGRGRHGTLVAGGARPRPSAAPASAKTPVVIRRLAATAEVAGAPGAKHGKAPLDWRVGQANVQTLPLDVWRGACREAGRHLPPAGYGDPRGDLSLRRAIADWLREHRSVVADPGQIVVTQGIGNALQLLARALLKNGDPCAVEDPGYRGAAFSFRQAGGVLQFVPVDEEGVMVDEIARSGQAPAVLHVTLAHQYPMGGRLSGARRRALAELARRRGMLVLENEYDCEFNYAGAIHPPLFSSAPENTVLLNTFAKAISPSLRLGFIVAPAPIASAVAGLVARERLHVSWPVQKVVEALLVSGELDRHLRRVRRHYGAIRDAIRERLQPYAPAIQLHGDQGGLHLIIAGEDRSFDTRLRKALRERGTLFHDVQTFVNGNKPRPGFLLAYGHMDEERLEASMVEIERSLRLV